MSRTTVDIKKSTLSLLSQLEAEEAGKRGSGGMVHDDFILFLLHLYMCVHGDDVVLAYARDDAMKAAQRPRK